MQQQQQKTSALGKPDVDLFITRTDTNQPAKVTVPSSPAENWELVSKISNLCDHKSPTSQTDGQTDDMRSQYRALH